MDVNNMFPSKYLKCADLKGKRILATISEMVTEEVGNERQKETKPVVYFEGKEKGLVLNKTNALKIAEIAGDTNTENWGGTRIVLFPTTANFNNSPVDCIRIDWPADAKKQQEVKSDDIPF